MARTQWTSEPPTIHGFYWHTSGMFPQPKVVRITELTAGKQTGYTNSRWYGPILPPKQEG